MAEALPLEPAIGRPDLKRNVSLGVPNREEAPCSNSFHGMFGLPPRLL